MTILIPAHRALTGKFAGRSFQVVTRYGYNPWLARVDSPSTSNRNIRNEQSHKSQIRSFSLATRNYATTASERPVGRPKQHTGRTPAKRTTKPAAAKKPGPKTAAGKSKVGRKPKAQSAAKPKAKPKPKAKKAVKKPVSEAALNRQRIAKEKDLKQHALLDPPKKAPHTAWQLIFSEAQKAEKGGTIAERTHVAKQAADKLKNLTPEEKEHYNHVAHLNKEKNDKAYKQWLAQYTPEQVKEANNARRQLKAIWAAKHNKTKYVAKFPPLQDERLVKRPTTPFIYFSSDRHASGDFHKMTIAESAALVGREWKAADAATKKKYEDQAQADLNRYAEEHKTVYGKDPPFLKN